MIRMSAKFWYVLCMSMNFQSAIVYGMSHVVSLHPTWDCLQPLELVDEKTEEDEDVENQKGFAWRTAKVAPAIKQDSTSSLPVQQKIAKSGKKIATLHIPLPGIHEVVSIHYDPNTILNYIEDHEKLDSYLSSITQPKDECLLVQEINYQQIQRILQKKKDADQRRRQRTIDAQISRAQKRVMNYHEVDTEFIQKLYQLGFFSSMTGVSCCFSFISHTPDSIYAQIITGSLFGMNLLGAAIVKIQQFLHKKSYESTALEDEAFLRNHGRGHFVDDIYEEKASHFCF